MRTNWPVSAKLTATNEVLNPLLAAHRAAKLEYEDALERIFRRKANLLMPYLADGQDTQAYIKYRQGSGWLNEVLLVHGLGHPQFGAAQQQLDVLATVSGYRTPDRPDVPDKALEAQKVWDAFTENYNHSPGDGGTVDKIQTDYANSVYAVPPMPPQPGKQGPGEPSTFRAIDSASRVYDRYVG